MPDQKELYRDHIIGQFSAHVERKLHPQEAGVSSPLFYGCDFPFGTYNVIPEISKYSLFLDTQMLLKATAAQFRHPHHPSVLNPAFHIALKTTTCRWKLAISAIAHGIHDYEKVQLFENIMSGLGAPSRPSAQVNAELHRAVRGYLGASADTPDFPERVKRIAYLLGEVCAVNGVGLKELYENEIKKHDHSATIKRFPQYLSCRRAELDTSPYSDLTRRLKLYFRDQLGVYEKILKGLVDRHVNIIASRTWTLLPMEVALAQLTVSCSANADLHHELRSIATRQDLVDVFFKYDVEPSDDSRPVLAYLSDHFLSTTYRPEASITEGIAYAQEYMARLVGEVASSGIRKATVMNVDVADSSDFAKRHGYVDTYAYMIHFRHLCEREFLRHRAVQHDWAGDGGVGIFEDALSCMEGAARALVSIRDAREFPEEFRIRIGIATGSLAHVLDREGRIGKETGEVLNRAGHLQKYVEAGSVAFDDETYEIVLGAGETLPKSKERTNEKDVHYRLCGYAEAKEWIEGR